MQMYELVATYFWFFILHSWYASEAYNVLHMIWVNESLIFL